MARWVTQTLDVSEDAEICIMSDQVYIGRSQENGPGGAVFKPTTREDANAMAIVLKLAAKRLEDIGKSLK